MKLDHRTFYLHSNNVPHDGQLYAPFFTGFLQEGHFGLIADERIASPTAPRTKPAKRPQISSSPIILIKGKGSLKDSESKYEYKTEL